VFGEETVFFVVVGVAELGLALPQASSHREAPLISQDPLADNTDVYAFVSPNRPDRVTLIANFIPLEAPYGGPNFFKFDDNVLYEIMVDNDGDAVEDVTFQFRFRTEVRNPNTFLYNTGTITSLDSAAWNVRQFYWVRRLDGPRRRGPGAVLGDNLPTPPVNVGFRSTPNYDALAAAAVRQLPNDIQVFAGQREDPFFVDLNVFDLLAVPPADTNNSDSLAGFNVHTIAIEVPITGLTVDLPRAEFFSTLVAFNLGVEAGQLTVILAAALTILALRVPVADYCRLVVRPASLAIALAGTFWTVERLIARS
jgi:hypothetical protein